MIRIAVLLAAGCSGTPRPRPREPTHRTGTGSAAPASLEERLHAEHAHAGRGRPAVSEIVRSTLDAGETRDHGLALRAGHCYSFFAVGGPDVEDLDLFLHDPSGFLVDWDRGRDATPVVHHCVSVDGPHVLRVKMYAGTGTYALRVFAHPAQRGPPAGTPAAEVPLSEE